MKHTHTPGPWQIRFDHIASESGRKIATIENRTLGEGFAESYENAFLIAAAPDMFEALQCVIDLLGDQEGIFIEQCKAALAKARGEA